MYKVNSKQKSLTTFHLSYQLNSFQSGPLHRSSAASFVFQVLLMPWVKGESIQGSALSLQYFLFFKNVGDQTSQSAFPTTQANVVCQEVFLQGRRGLALYLNILSPCHSTISWLLQFLFHLRINQTSMWFNLRGFSLQAKNYPDRQ